MHIGRLLHAIIREFYNKLYDVGTQYTNNNNIMYTRSHAAECAPDNRKNKTYYMGRFCVRDLK